MRRKNTNELYYLGCFFAAALGIYVILSFIGVTGGDYSIINGDMKDNYIPAIFNLLRNLKSGESIFYSWDYGMGMNMALSNAYYAYSPFNLLYLFCPVVDENIITILLIMIKTGLTAFCFRLFICKSYGAKGIMSLIIPLCYSLCSYQIIYNTQNIIWLDAMYVLPLICLEINRLIEEKRWLGLAFWYAYIFATQFYMGYMIGVISVAYFAMCLWLYSGDDTKAKSCILYVFAVAVALGLSAWSWIPTLMFLKESVNVGASVYDNVSLSLLDVINQLYWGEVSDYDAAFPYIYCGIPVVILAMRYFTDRDNSVKEKIGFGFMLVFLVVSCLVMPLYIFWHGFDSPNSFGFRFSYIISFLLCTIASIEGTKEDSSKISARWTISFAMVFAAIYVCSMIIQGRCYSGINLSNSMLYMGVNIGLCVMWFLGMKLCDAKPIIGGALILLTVIELVSNGYVTIKGRDTDGRQLSFNEYVAWKAYQTDVATLLEQDKSFYRVNSLNDLGPSSGLRYGYKSMSYFGSAENVKLRNVLGYLGIWNSPRIVYGYGLTPVTSMLFDVKYNIIGDAGIEGTETPYGHQAVISADNEILGLGYAVKGKPEQYNIPSTNAFENNNYLLSVMTGCDIKVFKPVSEDDYIVIENGLKVDSSDRGPVITYIGASDNKYASLIYSITDDNGKEYYAYIDNESSYYTKNAYVLMNGYENYINHNGAATVSYIKPLDRYESGPCLQIVSEGYKGEERFRKLCFASYNSEEKTKAYEELKKNVFFVSEYSNGFVRGEIESTDEKSLMFTSIPYEKGWSVYIDGEKGKIEPLMNEAFIGVSFVRPGKHYVEFKFTPPGVAAGGVVTLISVCIYVLAVIFGKRKSMVCSNE